MHASYPLLELLAVVFVLALIFGFAANKVGLSPIIGYLLAGFAAGPNFEFFPFVADPQYASQLAEAGVILLMFGVGLHFNLQDLLAVKGVAIPGAVAQSLFATILGTATAWHFGFSTGAGLVLGMGLAVASTVVLLRVLEENNILNTIHGHVAVGWLIVEDIFTVLILVLLPSIAITIGGDQTLSALELAKIFSLAVIKLVVLWVLILVIGGKVVPWVLTQVAKTRSQELFTLTILVTAFAIAVGAAEAFGASMALGAFLGGMVVGKSSVSHQAAADVLPLRDAFSVLFFVSVGMLFNPVFLWQNPGIVLACFLIVILAKPFIAIVVVTVLGYSVRTALTVSLGLAQVGEFSFILAQAAQQVNLVPEEIYSILVICAMASIVINPSLMKCGPKIEKFLSKRPVLWKILNYRADKKARKGNVVQKIQLPLDELEKKRERAIVIGYGPTGRNVVATLEEQGLTPVIIDMNVDTVNSLIKEGRHAVFGNSSKRDILRAAGVEEARYLIATIPDMGTTAATITIAMDMNPDLRVLSRARFLGDQKLLCQLGVIAIAFEEKEVAKALSNLVLEDLNKTLESTCEIAHDEEGENEEA